MAPYTRITSLADYLADLEETVFSIGWRRCENCRHMIRPGDFFIDATGNSYCEPCIQTQSGLEHVKLELEQSRYDQQREDDAVQKLKGEYDD